jgi:uncharacterized OB-fold protein
MSDMIQFVQNYDDLSTDRGYQFRFHCDRCGNGFMSHYEASTLGTAAGLLRAAGDLFGGVFSSAGNSAYDIQRAVGGKGHDDALGNAVQEGKQHFHQCTRCGKWVCPEVCWNGSSGLCKSCAPDEQEELAANKAQATAEQIAAKTREQSYVGDLDFSKAGMIQCGKCGAKMTANTKFCADCGTPAAAAQPKAHFCTTCGAKMEPGQKFCPGCGNKAG